ncbi:hypothetical protein, partial [Vibrio splendidus]|uniref:hypothetical protein n=1 Tax=Vibrio splendidus TaxID=29497 RepID=UPI00130005AE
ILQPQRPLEQITTLPMLSNLTANPLKLNEWEHQYRRMQKCQAYRIAPKLFVITKHLRLLAA